MRLINTRTLELEQFGNAGLPSYAILSHRWEEEEVLFDDMTAAVSKVHLKHGYAKIAAFCSEAGSQGFGYGWVDTCCIDKTSSAELSEAINSMYKWYSESSKCHAYLSDVTKLRTESTFREDFCSSRWFTRGWTLQELLAPESLVFYNRDWNKLGSKWELQEFATAVTKIDRYHLLLRPTEASVAQKMSWASERQTTRTQDIAYSLVGLFDVNIPLLYGEGMNAFRRLQLEIIQQSDDESIFAWTQQDAFWADKPGTALFADLPANFKNSQDIVQAKVFPWSLRTPYVNTNKGLNFEMRRLKSDADDLVTAPQSQRQQYCDYVVPLNCKIEGAKNQAIVLYFNDSKIFWGESRVHRVHINNLDSIELTAPEQQTVISKKVLVVGHRELRSGLLKYPRDWKKSEEKLRRERRVLE